MTSFVIGISGGSGSGKTRLTRELAQRLGEDRVSVLPFDAYYKDLRHMSLEERNEVNFDHPDSLDAEMFGHHLEGLRKGLDIALPVYDFSRHQRVDDLVILPAKEIIIAEGILLFAFPELLDKLDMTVFRKCPEDVRYQRRLQRDTVERGRSEESVRQQFQSSVAPMHNEFVEPSSLFAERVVEFDENLDDVADELASAFHAVRV